MANWSKRRSTKSGTYSRTTTTTNSKGGSTRSTSKRVGSGPRTTESIKQQNGKVTIRRYTTEYNPSLGTKRTTQTVYNTKQTKTPKPKKPRKTTSRRKSTASKRPVFSGYTHGYSNSNVSTSTNWSLWIHIATVIALLMIGWGSLWLIYVCYWSYVFIDDVT